MGLELNRDLAPAASGLKDRLVSKVPGGRGGSGSDSSSAPALAEFDHTPGFSFGGEGLRPKTTLDRDGAKREIVHPQLTKELVDDLTDHLFLSLDNLIGMRNEFIKDLGDQAGNAEFDRLLNTPRYSKYGRLYNELTAPKQGTGGGEVDIKLDAIVKYMSSDKGVDTIAELSKRELQEQLFSAALIAEMTVPDSGPAVIRAEDRNARVRKGGSLHELGRKFVHKMQEPRNVNGRIDPDRIAANIETKGDIVGAGLDLSALGGLGLPAAAYGLMRGLQKGERIELRQCMEVAQSIVQDPDALLWARRYYKLDPTDYELRGGQVELRADIESNHVQAGTRVDSKRLRDNLIGLSETVMKYQRQKGISTNLQTPMDSRWIAEGLGQAPQHGTDLEMRVIERMQGQRFDQAGQPSAIQMGEMWVANPLFNPNTVDIARNIARYDMIWDEEFQKDINEVFKSIINKKDYKQELSTEIDTKLGNYGPGSPAARRRIEEINSELAPDGPLGKDVKIIDRISATLEAYRTSILPLESARQARDQAVERAQQAVNELVSTVQQNGAAVEAGQVRRIINQVIENEASASVQLGDREIESIARRQRELDAAIEDRLDNVWGSQPGNAEPTAPDPADKPGPFDQKKPELPDEPTALAGGASDAEKADYKDRKTQYELRLRVITKELEVYDKARAAHDKRVADYRQQENDYHTRLESYSARREAARQVLREGAFKSRQERIDNDEQALTAFLAELTAANTEVVTVRRTEDEKVANAQRELVPTEANREVRNNLDTLFREMRDERDGIEAWDGTGGVDLSRAALASMSIDQLNERINQANQADPTVGWPREANGLDVNREILLKAMIESRLMEDGLDNLRAAIDPNIWGLSMADLLVMDTAGIRGLVQQRIDRLPAGTFVLPDDAEINDVILLARTQFEEMQVTLRDLKRANENRKRELGNEKVQVEENGPPIPQILPVLKRYSSRYGPIGAEITSEELDIAELFNLDVVNRANPEDAASYTAYEDGQSKSFVRMMQIMLAHREDSDAEMGELRGPEAAFRRNIGVISEVELGRRLAERFNLAVVGGPDIYDQAIAQISAMPDFTRKNLTEFLTEYMIYNVLRPQIQAL